MLKPGGRLVILEITQPQRPPLSTFFALWFDRLVPLLGTLAGDRDAYTYLPESVKRFPPPEGLAAVMDRAGLERIRYTVLAGGIIAIHSGRARPATRRAELVNRSRVPPPVTQVLDAASSWLPRRMAAVEERLAALVGSHGERLGAEAGATLAAGGKRLRPMLVLLCGGPEAGDGAVRAATAVELVHMATLVHDDVLDAAPLRRGQPDRRRPLRPRRGDRGRRPAVLARLRRALRRRRRRRAPGAAARRRLARARPGRAGAAPRRLRRRDRTPSATSSAAG